VAETKGRSSEDLRLKAGISVSQTRFALSNFCLSNFRSDGQYFADVLELCIDSARLQEALNLILAEVRSRCPERVAALAACVRDVNDTDAETAAPESAAAAPGLRPSAAPRPRAALPATAAPKVPGGSPPPAASTPGAKVPRAVGSDALALAPGISLAQARFALSEFCLDQFGARAQPLVDAINGVADQAGFQKILGRIGREVREHHREWMPKLLDCVREINETSG
jgi:hypothetical protein